MPRLQKRCTSGAAWLGNPRRLGVQLLVTFAGQL